jgi:hypothetical protein
VKRDGTENFQQVGANLELSRDGTRGEDSGRMQHPSHDLWHAEIRQSVQSARRSDLCHSLYAYDDGGSTASVPAAQGSVWHLGRSFEFADFAIATYPQTGRTLSKKVSPNSGIAAHDKATIWSV